MTSSTSRTEAASDQDPQHLRRAEERLTDIQRLSELFPDLPVEALIKEDLLRIGISFSRDALEYCAGFKSKSYFIFSFDMIPIDQMDQQENLRAPEEIQLFDGPWNLRRTTVSIRVNPTSPWNAVREGESLILRCGDQIISRIDLQQIPQYYQTSLESGQPVHEVAPTIEWGYLIYLTVYRKCQYFGFKEECRFCDINENYRQQVSAGRPYRTVKPQDDVIEALSIIDATSNQTKAYTLTGGSIIRNLRGQGEAEFYASYARAIEERFPGRWIPKAVTQALPVAEQQILKDAGIQIYHPNYEIWDERLFSILCPGKEAYVGRSEWHRRIIAATDIFGAENVIPNFVAGIEMSQPHGYTDPEQAVSSTREGLDFFMSQGVCPRFTVWCPEPLSPLVKDQPQMQPPAPLEYHARLLVAWRDCHREHGLPVPPGYGPPGAGNAIFSVSSFMDVIEVAGESDS
ncbi:MAG: radical SAM protein [Planctomycetota bacterium]|nr:radical SAM protein [Planctomycetota bacterium]